MSPTSSPAAVAPRATSTVSAGGVRRPVYVPARETGGRRLKIVLLVLWVIVAGAGLGFGWAYYRLPLAERPFSALHDLLAPTGRIGLSLGMAGALMMVAGVGMYSVRKRLPALHGVGRLRYWLQVHIFLCTLGPFLVLLHTSFRFGGIVSVAFWCMIAVVLSGVFGRYVYVRVPKTIHGQFRSLESIERMRAQLVETIGEHVGVPPQTVDLVLGRHRLGPEQGLLRSIIGSIRFDLGRRRRAARLNRVLEGWNVPIRLRGRLLGLLERQAQVEQQILRLQPFQRLFRYWHIFHLPLAVVMFVVLAFHVAIAFMFGYGWPL